ncbi:hypothetical protein ACE1SV_74010 [Streptomyces sp. E-15]
MNTMARVVSTVLTLSVTTAALLATALPASAAETDWSCTRYTPAQSGSVLGEDCHSRPGDTGAPVRLYRTGAVQPAYLCASAHLSDDGTHILGVRCTTV